MTGNRTANPITNIILGVAFVAVGVALFVYWGKPTFEKAQASKNWPTVSGVVKTSEVTVSETRDRKKRSTMYTPEIAFTYDIDGRSYVSSQIGVSSGWSSSNSSSAYQLTNKYPVGEPVVVAYDPANPSFAVLETGAGWSTYFIYYLGPGFVGLGLFCGVGPIVMFVFALCFARSSTTHHPARNQQLIRGSRKGILHRFTLVIRPSSRSGHRSAVLQPVISVKASPFSRLMVGGPISG